MDWDKIDEELYKVAPEFKDPRFDSLRLVLSIVSSVNAEARVEEVGHSSSVSVRSGLTQHLLST